MDIGEKMKLGELDRVLREYTWDELFYRDYYYAKQNVDTFKEFIDKLDMELIKNNNLFLPELSMGMTPYIFTENYSSLQRNGYNVLTLKHSRYNPVFIHQHEFFEMIYVYSGNCKQKINNDEIVLNEGDICIISPKVEHSISVFDDSVIINILIKRSTFNDTFLKVLSDENVLSSFFIKILYTNNFNNYIIFRTNNNPEIREILMKMIIEDRENKKYSNKVLENLLMIFFVYVLRDDKNIVVLPQELHKNNKSLTSILTYIQGNYKTVTLDELSDKFHFTVPYLSKLIKISIGHSFKEIIQIIKLNKAVELLTTSNMKICDISETIGYENDTHFIRTFKKVYGVSPNQYRKEKCIGN